MNANMDNDSTISLLAYKHEVENEFKIAYSSWPQSAVTAGPSTRSILDAMNHIHLVSPQPPARKMNSFFDLALAHHSDSPDSSLSGTSFTITDSDTSPQAPVVGNTKRKTKQSIREADLKQSRQQLVAASGEKEILKKKHHESKRNKGKKVKKERMSKVHGHDVLHPQEVWPARISTVPSPMILVDLDGFPVQPSTLKVVPSPVVPLDFPDRSKAPKEKHHDSTNEPQIKDKKKKEKKRKKKHKTTTRSTTGTTTKESATEEAKMILEAQNDASTGSVDTTELMQRLNNHLHLNTSTQGQLVSFSALLFDKNLVDKPTTTQNHSSPIRDYQRVVFGKDLDEKKPEMPPTTTGNSREQSLDDFFRGKASSKPSARRRSDSSFRSILSEISKDRERADRDRSLARSLAQRFETESKHLSEKWYALQRQRLLKRTLSLSHVSSSDNSTRRQLSVRSLVDATDFGVRPSVDEQSSLRSIHEFGSSLRNLRLRWRRTPRNKGGRAYSEIGEERGGVDSDKIHC